jgi:hypothetical protein
MHAAVTMTFTDGTNCVTIVGSAAPVTCPTFASGWSFTDSQFGGPHGTMIASGTIGAFTLNITTGRGGVAETRPALINLNSINVNSGGAGTLTIMFSDDQYLDFSPLLNLSSSGTIIAGTAVGSSISFNGEVNTLNIGTLGPFTQTSASSATSAAATANFANPDGSSGTLLQTVVLAFTGGGEIDSGFTIANVAVPEPASIVFLGTAVLGLTALIRKKRVKRS